MKMSMLTVIYYLYLLLEIKYVCSNGVCIRVLEKGAYVRRFI